MMPPGTAIRHFVPEDLPTLQEVRAAAFEPVFRSFHSIVGGPIAAIAFAGADAEQAKLLEEICGPTSRHEVLVATVGGEIVGYVSFTVDAQARMGEIGLNAVRPAHAGRGIGTAMYRHVLALMRERGAAAAAVSTGGDPGHAPARRAYEKAGFGPAIPSVTLYKLL
jgi:GNAT superfamily N-acetyltransferase